ncbi:hypothetical protein BC670_3010 [Flavobacterium branchiophilum]|uniref:Aminopeptidase n=2 Tax=Flavobacterium branchiophilum TaxID=55197 RepID=A0A543G7C3_9FLAO|nr:hypothetical protein BC670_3010 [Flavobacterium branchiophilum]
MFKQIINFFLYSLFLLINCNVFSQNIIHIDVKMDDIDKKMDIVQQVTYHNISSDTLTQIVLNDWNHAYSSKNTFLAARFSDEFVRTFHLSSEKDKGYTQVNTVFSDKNKILSWERPAQFTDFIIINLPEKLAPNQKINFTIHYQIKLPHAKFTDYGFDEKGNYHLKDCFLLPCRFENHQFVMQQNADLEDAYLEKFHLYLNFKTPKNLNIFSDLIIKSQQNIENINEIILEGNNKMHFTLICNTKADFLSYKNNDLEIQTNLTDKKLAPIEKILIINKVCDFVNKNLGTFPHSKLLVSQADYDRNPLYGLSQLPSFLSPFSNEFIFEQKFLKTYLNNYLRNSLQINIRKDNFLIDGIQIFLMMQYMEENYPDMKMTGSLSKLKLLQGYHVFQLDFNEQYSYFYMLMARKNLDQPIGDSKETLIRFNDKIAGKYRSGLSFKYLDAYLGNEIVLKSFQEYFNLNKTQITSRADLKQVLQKKAPKKIDWFFDILVDKRDIIDYKISHLVKKQDSLQFTIQNRTQTNVPIPLYGLKNNQIVFKKWIENVSRDSIFTFPKTNIDHLVLNLTNEVPEYNRRNNWKKIKGFFPNNKPFSFAFMKDIEDADYNQILYVPVVGYNLYDGVTVGMRFHNSAILNKPFNYDIQPLYASKTKSLTGSFSVYFAQFNRQSRWYRSQFGLSGLMSHYAPDALYTKITPFVGITIRENDLRDNKRQFLNFRYVAVNRATSNFVTFKETDNYGVFDAKYGSNNTEMAKKFGFLNNLQLSSKFGKIATNFEFRKLYENNRQLNVRWFAGAFLYRNTATDFFSFALDRPTDYLFDYNYLGRSESHGLFSQQIIIAEGGFKTKLTDAYANQWLTAINASTNIWNWVEVYGDVSAYKNQYKNSKFVFDSGIRLNFVPDYFELYFPIYSSNGWDITNKNYNQKIRFIVTLSTTTLSNLFTRKWF